MLSRSLIAGLHVRSSPSSCRLTRPAASARNSTRPANRTSLGSFATRRAFRPASMRERSPLAQTRASGFPSWPVILLLLTLPLLPLPLQSAPATPRVILESSFRNRRLNESSGVAVSRKHRGLLWTHNDSGDGPYVYATDLSGADRGTVQIRRARAVDW